MYIPARAVLLTHQITKLLKSLVKLTLNPFLPQEKDIQSKHLGIKNQVQTVTKFIIQEIRISKNFQLKRL